MISLKKLHINLFTLLMIIAGVALLFRAVNIVTFKNIPARGVNAIMSAQAVEEKAGEVSHEEPPPLTSEDIKKSIAETAKEVDGKTPSAGKKEESGSSAPPSALTEDFGARTFSAPEIEVLQSLSKRRDDLDKREQKLAAREALLSAAEQEVDRKVEELNKLRGEIEGLLGKQQTMEDDRIASLVKIYEGMKPKEAATIFNTLNMDILLAVISRMNERKSSPILASMDPDKARLVTIKLAEQRKLPAEEAKKPPAATVPPAAP